MGDTDYIFAVARIRVKETELLKDADISQMVSMKDAQDVIDYLADRGWGDAQSEQDAQQMLAMEQEKCWALMKELGLDDALFQVIQYPKLYHNLKAAIKETCSQDAPSGIYFDTGSHSREELLRIISEKDYSHLPLHMREAAREAYELMATRMDGQKCDMIIDRACLTACLEAAKASKNKLLIDYEESQVAVTDIKIAVRAAAAGKPAGFLNDALAPCSLLDIKGLAQAAGISFAALTEYLEKHGFAEAAETLKISPSAFERWCDNKVIQTLLPQKRNSVSAGPILAYYLARENEI